MNIRRPLTLILAILLLVLLGLFGLITPFRPDQPPPPVVIFAFTGGVVALIAVVGLWMLRRWGLWLAIIVQVLTLLVAVPGLWLAPSTEGKLVSVVIIPVNALVLLLLALPATHKAVAAAHPGLEQA
ncbi:MAG: hypothetical protein M3014_07250 [Chloroflexota bacterium]|nr:hypothetical protein [Chloroflexota bacterium]